MVVLNAIIVCLHPSVSLNNEHGEDKMSICTKTACLREVFRFELSVFKRESSCKNISVQRIA